MRNERIMVLMGGASEENAVSRNSGANVLNALHQIGYEAVGVEFDAEFINMVLKYKPDLVFLAVHGDKGENGAVQGFLDVLGIPYTGSNLATSAICMDKVITKKLLCYDQIPTADFRILREREFVESGRDISGLVSDLGLPLVVKPASQGSSIGTSIVKQAEDLPQALEQAFDLDPNLVVEKFIDGVEVTVAVMGNNEAYVLPVLEIVPEAGEFYDYESKYATGGSSHIIPPRLPESLIRQIEDIARHCYETFGCRGFARIDMMVDVRAEAIYVLELNTVPGMTNTSLVPDAARAAGISWEEFVEKAVRLALQEKSGGLRNMAQPE